MKNLLREVRASFFDKVTARLKNKDVQLVLLTHILPDRPELIDAIKKVGHLACVIGIPYSANSGVIKSLKDGGLTVHVPELEQLKDSDYIADLVVHSVDIKKNVVILEIGGYFARAMAKLKGHLGDKLLGIVEDTEAGHREYRRVQEEGGGRLPCPVISVARSTLKEGEDLLVGASCIFSAERLLREVGYLVEAKVSLVLGYGRVGKGVAQELHARHCHVMVCDTNPIRRSVALAEGFSVPERDVALRKADIIFGATGICSVVGDDFSFLKNGVILASCSSKDVEFDLTTLKRGYARSEVVDPVEVTVADGTKKTRPRFTKYSQGDRQLYLLHDGRPVNFLDEAVIGPVLTLVQAEILAAACLIQDCRDPVLTTLKEEQREEIARLWLEEFCDRESGFYRQA